MKKVVVVLGMHRSGTSVVTKACQCMGAYLGEQDELMAATVDNMDGYFENKEIVRINEDILHLCNREWYSLEKQDIDFNHPHLIEAAKNLKVILEKLLEKSDVVAVKDPRISILLPIWGKILEELGAEIHFIWMFRSPLEVAESLRKRGGYGRKHSLLLWTYYNLSILKFLKEKQYLLVNYRDVLEKFQVFMELSQEIGQELDSDLNWELQHIVKQGYCHSNYSDNMIRNIQNELALDFYNSLLTHSELELNVIELERKYVSEIPDKEDRYIDYEVLEDIECLKEKRIIIYGAGNYGREAAKMLQHLGLVYGFCDRDVHKQGSILLGGKVFSVTEIEKWENLCVIIAIQREDIKKEIEQTLQCIKGTSFLSLFTLKKIYKYFMEDYTSFAAKAGAFSFYYKRLMMRADNIRNACECQILVYQSGKMGSTTVKKSLLTAGVENAHIHGFFFKNDVIGELVLGKEYKDFIKSCNILDGQLSGYIEIVKKGMKGKKIITMVREPIAVDLSTVFQWTGAGSTDRYFAQCLKQGKTFVQSVAELMVRIQGRLFRWFDEELKEITDVNVLEYPFDRDKGYGIIAENGVEILIIKAEKLSQMTEVIRNFTGNYQVKLVNENVGKDKEYAHIYEAVKKNLKIPREYVEYYYKENIYMDHFYTEDEKEIFMKKWAACIK